MDFQKIWETVRSWLFDTGVKIVLSFVILAISFAIINRLSARISTTAERANGKKKLDKTVYRTLGYVTKIGLKILVIIAIISYLGIDTGGLTALIASLGVGFGLAVNGTLSNFAGGMLLLLTRPFRDDDFIEACGYSGTVEDILICYTKIRTPDNKVVYLPNGKLSTTEIVNYSEKELRRVDLTFSVSYSADFEKAKAIITDILENHERIVKDPAPSVRVAEQSASSIDLGVKAWCGNADYWTVRFDLLEEVKKAFDRNGIEIPFNQLDVHLKND